MNQRTLNPVWLLGGLALVIRAAWVLYRWQQNGAAFSYPDEELHWQLGYNLVHDGRLVSDDGRYAARMPLYPLFLALFAWLGTWGVLAARLVQALLGGVTTIIAVRLCQDAAGRRAGWIGGVLVCFDPFGVFFANLLLTEVPFTTVALALAASTWHWLISRRGAARAVVGAALLGPAAILIRPSAAALVPLLWVLVFLLSADRRRELTRIGLCVVVLVIAFLPWGVRNKLVLGDWAWLSSNGGVTLYDAQGPQADGSSDQSFLQNMPELERLGEVARDEKLQQMALHQMHQDPGRVLRLAGVKLLRTWSLTPNVAEHSHGATAWISAVYTLVVLLGAVAGVVVMAMPSLHGPREISRRLRRLHVIVWLTVGYFTLVHCVYIGSVRYRVPLMPLLALAAATAVVDRRAATRA